MVVAAETLSLLSALHEGASADHLGALLAGRELTRIFPAVGISQAAGLHYLRAVAGQTAREELDEAGREVAGYFSELLQRRGELLDLVREIRAEERSLVASAWARTTQLLPPSCPLGDVRLVLLPIALDFRTDRESVYMDPLAALALGREGIVRTLAHELHHVGRYWVTGQNLTLMSPDPPITDVHAVFSEWATWLEAEGIADCVSNAVESDIPLLHEMVGVRRRQMAESPNLLRGALARIRRTSASVEDKATELEPLRRDLRLLAHPIGARMAESIRSGFGREALVDCVGHPASFLGRYNELAATIDEPMFDGTLLLWLNNDGPKRAVPPTSK